LQVAHNSPTVYSIARYTKNTFYRNEEKKGKEKDKLRGWNYSIY
jgi:hypothetical protein